MEIQNLKINQYRSIKNPVHINSFHNFQILVGPNNAGKTNILNALEILLEPKGKKLRSNEEIQISGQIKINQNTYNLQYSNNKISYDCSRNIYKAITKKKKRIQKQISFQNIATKQLKTFKSQHSERYHKFTSTLESHFQDIHISEELFVNNIQASSEKQPFQRMGEGFKRLFVILFYIYHPDYELILIDEPELHLHPTSIKKLMKIIRKEELNNQIFITTHHPTLVQAKLLNKTWRVARDGNLSTSVYQIQDSSTINKERLVQEINDDNSAMLFTDKVLLVEGISDSLLMRGLIDRFYQGDKDIKVVYSGGKGNINLYEKICKAYNIPYIIMLDGDALNEYWKKTIQTHPQLQEKINKREALRSKNIFILEGNLEDNYPQKYQQKDTKPLNALLAGNKIQREEYNSSQMEDLREIIKNL